MASPARTRGGGTRVAVIIGAHALLPLIGGVLAGVFLARRKATRVAVSILRLRLIQDASAWAHSDLRVVMAETSS